MNYAVTAATGKFGQVAVKTLNRLVGAPNVVAIARNVDKAKLLFPDNEVRQGDYEDKQSMVNALEKIDRVLFISSQPGGKIDRATAQRNAVDAMAENNVKFVAYTSFPMAQTSTSALAADHRATENAIKEVGLEHSFLRNNWYLENEIVFLKAGASDNDAFYWANNHAGWALEREYAEAAAKVVAAENPQEVYELAGQSSTYEDLGEALKEATGNHFAVKQVTSDDYVKYLESTGLDHATAVLFASFQAPINDGSLEENTSDLAKALGHEPLSLPAAIKEVLA